MASNSAEVRLILNAVNNASKTLDDVTKSVSGMGKASQAAGDFIAGMGISFDKLANPAMLAGELVAKFGQYAKEAVDETAAYGKEVEDMARKLGIGAEEASKLIQVADDLEIETGALNAAMRAALKQGIVPSIDNLAKMAEEYQALPTAADKARYALDKFGRSGLEMQKFLETAPDDIRDMAEAAENLGLVMSGEAVKAAKEYRLALDDLQDTFQGLKYEVGNSTIPVLTDLITYVQGNIMVDRVLAEQMDKGNISFFDRWKWYKQVQLGLKDANLIVEEATAKERDYEAQVNATNRVEEIRAATYTNQLNPAMEQQLGITEQLTASMQNYSTQLLFNQAAQNMDSDAAFALARSLGLVDERTVLAKEEIDRLTEAFDTNNDGMIDGTEAASGYATAVQRLDERLSALDGKITQAQLDVFVNMYSTGMQAEGHGDIQERASGGPVSPGGTYLVGENGPEILRMGSGGGGYVYPNVTNNFTLNMTSNAPVSTVRRDFAIMKSLAGA